MPPIVNCSVTKRTLTSTTNPLDRFWEISRFVYETGWERDDDDDDSRHIAPSSTIFVLISKSFWIQIASDDRWLKLFDKLSPGLLQDSKWGRSYFNRLDANVAAAVVVVAAVAVAAPYHDKTLDKCFSTTNWDWLKKNSSVNKFPVTPETHFMEAQG